MVVKTEKVLNNMGWKIVNDSPLEIEHEDGSFASGQAAYMAINPIYQEWLEYQKRLSEQKRITHEFSPTNLKRLYDIIKVETFDKQLKECKTSVDFCLLKQHYVTLQKYANAAECRDMEKKAIEKEETEEIKLAQSMYRDLDSYIK